MLGLHSRMFNLIELVIALTVTGTFCLPECGLVRKDQKDIMMIPSEFKLANQDRLLIVILSVIGSVSSGTFVSGLK